MENEEKKTIEIVIGFDVYREEIKYIKSDFMSKDSTFKDPVGYTFQLLQMAVEKWLKEKIGIFCPNCEEEINDQWEYCPNCGWNQNE